VLLARGLTNRILRTSDGYDDVMAYEAMKKENSESSALYQAGEFWARLNRQHANAIWGGGLEKLRDEYFNRTFSGPQPESRQVYRALLFLYFKKVQELDVDGFLERHEDPQIGGTYDQELICGRACSLDFLQSVEEAYRIRAAWRAAGRSGDPSVLVELGAGYGRLAYVCRRMMPTCTYVILDLPEALICAQSWLSRTLGADVVPHGAGRGLQSLGRTQLAGGNVFLFLPHRIAEIQDSAVDAFVNIYSFAEMPKASIDNYFRQLDRITEGVLFMKQRKQEVNAFDGVRISEETYPIPQHWRELQRSTTTLYEDFFEVAFSTRMRS
jgi:putative sugar O-methyltransferase